ncbi:recombinase family protein [Salmonella enterica subsp. enterica serovar Bareilly]
MAEAINQPLKVVTYRRVSTGKQERSGLGMEAQTEYIEQAIAANGWVSIADFSDAALSGGLSPEQRPGLTAALEVCRKTGASLLVAKIDRLSRSVADTARVMEQVNVKVATMPHADNFQLHLFAALAEQEKAFIQQRTRDALAALQARADAGETEAAEKIARRNATIQQVLTHKPHIKAQAVRSQKADTHAQRVRGAIMVAQDEGCTSLAEIAHWLNTETDIRTPRGCEWSPVAVKRIIDRNASIKAGKNAA